MLTVVTNPELAGALAVVDGLVVDCHFGDTVVVRVVGQLGDIVLDLLGCRVELLIRKRVVFEFFLFLLDVFNETHCGLLMLILRSASPRALPFV